ncbi:MAG: acyl carrier protein [Magnetococcales bacterium]|nr:acyl carrier protein [Magnetococcales bacterium]
MNPIFSVDPLTKGDKEMQPGTEQKLQEIFRAVLELDESESVASLRSLTEPRWNSLAHVSLLAAIESEFNLTLTIEEMDRITSYAAACLLLEEKEP